MRCPQPDWLDNRLTVTGPAAALAAFRAAATGAGIAPWVLDYDAIEEDLLHRLLAPPPAARGISLAGARILARHLRDLAWQEHEAAIAQLDQARGCPFDLHRLVPVPWSILRLGPDHPAALGWLFAHWGTTWPLRRVEARPLPGLASHALAAGESGTQIQFWSADWSPWPVILACRARWPALRFSLAVEYWWTLPQRAPAPAARRAAQGQASRSVA